MFALALGCLHQKKDSLDFSVHFNDVMATSRNGGSQYTVLHEARAWLTQPLITQGKSKGKRRSDAIPLFTIITLDEGMSSVAGQFNLITQSSAETPELGNSKKALTLSDIAEFRELLVTKYKELLALYDWLRLDFELKEY